MPVLLLAAVAQATNFLVIVVDDMGFDKMGAYEEEAYGDYAPTYLPATPTFDAMAAGGLRFTNVYASPVCSPTRAGLLTGRHAYEHDVGKTVNESTAELGATEVTIAEVLQDTAYVGSAYDTAMIGKWHLGDSSPGGTDWSVPGEYEDVPNPNGQGFDLFAGILDGQPDDYYAWTGLYYPELLTNGATGAIVEDSTEYAGELAVAVAYDWITTRTAPWLAYVMLTSAHADEEENNDEYEPDDLPPGWDCDDLDGDGDCTNPELFAALVTYADDQVASLLDDLAEDDPATLEDTLIVLLGDNGTPEVTIEGPWEASGERNDQGKNTAFESGVRVPLVFLRGCDWMDLQDGRDDDRYADGSAACSGTTLALTTPGLSLPARIQTEDLFATLNSLAGSTYPPPSTSVDLAPCLSATSANASNCGISSLTSRRMYTETFRREYTFETNYATEGLAVAGTLGIKRGNYKLIAELEGSGSRLCARYRYFDLGSDPYETNDLRTGGDRLTTVQSSQYIQLRGYLRNTIHPEWLTTTACR